MPSSGRPSTSDERRAYHDHLEHSLFERYAWALGGMIPRCSGELVGSWLPTKFAGPTNSGLALIDFPNRAADEQYRERLAKDADNSVRRADESGCILVEDRAILERRHRRARRE
jgi:hypothetical protein